MTYGEACGYIENIPKFTSKNRPEHTRELLERLGHPEECFRVIHVAGTNGKGSVCAYLESILREEGFLTGLFTSPHLVSIRERFQIGRKPVGEEEFLDAFQKVRSCVRQMQADGLPHPAYFEFLFAMGMLIFRRKKIDVLVMETGLGGRLDATNSVMHPDLTVITSISFDHTEYLGSTIGQIAGEKAGIIKKGVPVIADGFPRKQFDIEEALGVIRVRAEEMHAPLTIVSPLTGAPSPAGSGKERAFCEISDICYMEDGIEFSVSCRFYDHVRVHLPFLADYQIENCLLAMTAAAVFGNTAGGWSEKTVLTGIRNTRWPGRMERVLPGIVVDGAHNDDGIEQLLRTVRRVAEKKKVSLLFSAVRDKDYTGMVREMCEGQIFSSVVTTEIPGPRKVPACELADIFRRYTDAPVEAEADIGAAFRLAKDRKKDSVLFCAGSLYLAGGIEAEILRQERGRRGER